MNGLLSRGCLATGLQSLTTNLQHLICLARRNMPSGTVNWEMDRKVSAFSGEEIELLIRPAYLCVCFVKKAHTCA